VPVTEEGNLISKETNPGCGIGHEKVIAVSTSPATCRLRTICENTAKEKKEKRKKRH